MFRRLIAVALATAAVGLVPVVQAPPAQAAQNNDTLVQAWYRTFLGRDYSNAAADTGRYYWVDMLNRGVSREYVLGGILRNNEYANREVSSYYTDYLGRPADRGAAYWIDQTAHHDMAWEWVAQNVLASQEYFNLYNYSGTAEEFVENLYIDVLGRYPTDADAGGINYWARRYYQVGSLNLVRELWYTDEAVSVRLDDHYRDLLYRGVDFDGLNYWAPRERQSDISVQVALASTNEFFSNRAY